MKLQRSAVLGWRLGRHFLTDPASSVEEVVRRLVAVPAVSGDPELSVGLRLAAAENGAVSAALAADDLICTYAFRGATHLMVPDVAADHLALRALSRQWELKSWQTHYGLTPRDWVALRDVVEAAFADGPLTRIDLADAVAAHPDFAHLRPFLADKSHTLLKPLAWLGALRFGPTRDGTTTFRNFEGVPGWQGTTDPDVAGPRAIGAHLAAYGPATREQLHYWLCEGLSVGRKRLDGWLSGLRHQLVEVDLDGDPALCLPEHQDELAAATALPLLRLLPGLDQWVMGPGTRDDFLVPAARRGPVSRGANLVVRGGRVSGSWKLDGDVVRVSWFPERGDTPPDSDLRAEVQRLGRHIGRPLEVEVRRDEL